MHFTRSVVAMRPDQEPFEEEKEHNSPKKSGKSWEAGTRSKACGINPRKAAPSIVPMAEQVLDKALADSPPDKR